MNSLSTKTQRFKTLRRQYQSYLERVSCIPGTTKFSNGSSRINESLDNQESDFEKTTRRCDAEKMAMLDKYLENIHSDKVEPKHEIKPSKDDRVKTLDELSKKLALSFDSNKANSIAEDIMKSIYDRHYKKDLIQSQASDTLDYESDNENEEYVTKTNRRYNNKLSMENSYLDSEKPKEKYNVLEHILRDKVVNDGKKVDNFETSYRPMLSKDFDINAVMTDQKSTTVSEFNGGSLKTDDRNADLKPIRAVENDRQQSLQAESIDEPSERSEIKFESSIIGDEFDSKTHAASEILEDTTNNGVELNTIQNQNYNLADNIKHDQNDNSIVVENQKDPDILQSKQTSNIYEHDSGYLQSNIQQDETVQEINLETISKDNNDEINVTLQTHAAYQSGLGENSHLIQQQFSEYDTASQQPITEEYDELLQQQSEGYGHQEFDENAQIIYENSVEHGQTMVQQQFENEAIYGNEEQPLIQQQYENQQQYDEKGQPILQQENEIPKQYDENGQPIQQHQYEIQQEYDEKGQPILQQQYEIQQLYDENGQLYYQEQYENEQQYENGEPILQQQYGNEYRCDETGQSIPQQYYKDEQRQYVNETQYDEKGQPILHEEYRNDQEYDEGGQSTSQQQYENAQQYDEHGQLILQQNYEQYDVQDPEVIQYDESGQPILQHEENFQFDANGQPTIQSQYIEQGYDVQYDENGKPVDYVLTYNNQVLEQTTHQSLGQPNQQGNDNQNTDSTIDDDSKIRQSSEAFGEPVINEKKNSIIQDQKQVASDDMNKNNNVLDLLDTDTESAKQNTSKISNDSDFDFSNG